MVTTKNDDNQLKVMSQFFFNNNNNNVLMTYIAPISVNCSLAHLKEQLTSSDKTFEIDESSNFS